MQLYFPSFLETCFIFLFTSCTSKMSVLNEVSATGMLPNAVVKVMAARVVEVPDFVTVQLQVRSFLQAMKKTMAKAPSKTGDFIFVFKMKHSLHVIMQCGSHPSSQGSRQFFAGSFHPTNRLPLCDRNSDLRT
ncbi:MAG: hypothetical protein JWO32_825 [Bacteroidetes bacterium]|nr:hypothetical protein [Bacteroidota bacterium]